MTSTSNTKSTSAPKEGFVFDCDHLLQFCDRFNRTPIEEQSESVLEVKLKDLDARWVKVEASYEGVMLASDNSIKPEFKEEAKTNFNASNRRLNRNPAKRGPRQREYRSNATNRPSESSSKSRSNHRRSASRRPSESRNRQDQRNRTSHHQNRLDPDLYQCRLCMRFHAIRFCPKFMNMTVIRRIEMVTRHKYCVNVWPKAIVFGTVPQWQAVAGAIGFTTPFSAHQTFVSPSAAKPHNDDILGPSRKDKPSPQPFNVPS
ncbi:hypothetical protein CVS40_12018 [Lucilia cuprina]|nr:hypothetical protein CVS40_12018 [Lucilia cuprina]